MSSTIDHFYLAALSIEPTDPVEQLNYLRHLVAHTVNMVKVLEAMETSDDVVCPSEENNSKRKLTSTEDSEGVPPKKQMKIAEVPKIPFTASEEVNVLDLSNPSSTVSEDKKTAPVKFAPMPRKTIVIKPIDLMVTQQI